MNDTLPLWFWLPLSVILWSAVAVIYVRARRAERAEIAAEAERIEAWNWGPGTDVIEHCAHDWSLTGAEGPVRDLGRSPVLWNCDVCGAAVLEP